MVFRTAATGPERIGAAAPFTAVAWRPTSHRPHLLIPKMNAEFVCAVADKDQ
jgi:hypothetical protein